MNLFLKTHRAPGNAAGSRGRIARLAAAASLLAAALLLGSCAKTISPTALTTLRIRYDRVAVPCPGCLDEPWVYVLWGNENRVITGELHKVAENSFEGTIDSPTDLPIRLNINDSRMYDGLNPCSNMEVAKNITVNGYPVRVYSHDCAPDWAGQIVLIVSGDGRIDDKAEPSSGF